MTGARGGWLLALAGALTACTPAVDASWHREPGHRWRALDVRGKGAGFTMLGPGTTGLTHANTITDERALANRHLLLGAGAAIADVDGDGLPDLFLPSVEQPAALYRNRGSLRFEDVTAASGIHLQGRATMGATFADVDGDGDPDLLVGSLGGPITLHRNDGQGHFTDVTPASGLDSGYAATTLTLADVDGDGDLDLYVATYKVRNTLDAVPPQARAFDQVVKKVGDRYEVVPAWQRDYRIEDRPDLGGIVRFQRAEEDLFYLNDGTGHFVRQSVIGDRWRDEDGRPLTEAPDYFSLAARFYDVNGDGAPDLYVCNDFEDPDQFWLNDGRGNFRLVPRLAIRATSNTCMSVDFGDVNRDGHVDLFTADMQSPTLAARQRQVPTHTPLPKVIGESPDRAQWMRNALQVSRGDGTWAQVADFAGVAASDWTWGSAFVDVDLDGYEDLLLAAGHHWDVRDADTFDRIRNAFPRVPWNREQGEFPRLAVPNVAFRNAGDGTFADASRAWGFAGDSAVSHGIALADFDGDGDLDPLVTRLNDAPRLYRNEGGEPRLAVQLKGRTPNPDGIGARVEVRFGGLPNQSREMTRGGYYLSGSDAQLVFAATADTTGHLIVRWRSGRWSEVTVRANTLVEVEEPTGDAVRDTSIATPVALFADATALLGGHQHLESRFDDFTRQPLLPNRFSQFGPGIAWGDLDGDGRDDLVVGAGRGQAMGVLRNTGRDFVNWPGGAVLPGDQGGLAVMARDGRAGVISAVSSYESSAPAERGAALRWAAPGAGGLAWTEVVGPDSSASGPIAVGDVNGDGRPDIFVGVRVVPGRWPLPAASHLWLAQPDGSFSEDRVNAQVLSALGLVTGATFADLDGNGAPDLVVASEWGPVRVLLNEGGRLTDATSRLGLSGISSRWMGVTAGDFDGDGRLDLVATSWGRNLPWHATSERPVELHVARVDSTIGLVFAQRDSASGRTMPLESRARLGVALSSVREGIGSYAAYASATVADVLGDAAAQAIRVGATTFDHTLFLNRGTAFEARPLPRAAQVAPSFGPVVADFDGDGREDLYLAQNFYPTEIDALRQDAGAGLILLGDGTGGFRALSVRDAGISALGDQRGAATADYDGDGRPDLAVGQNGWRTRLFRNVGAAPGLRVVLEGTPANPRGVGAQLRVIRGASRGPVREVRAGTGPWSSDSPVTVMALPAGADSLWVRWPGGVEQVVPIAGPGTIRVKR
ncbi:MAG: VCBS repeat-containing protein [Gemmatimonadetes bacterium]|nr:VCBS repeat-containing protein [Gemmatimonadota bacterium]